MISNSQLKVYDLEERTLKFAESIIDFCRALPKDMSNSVITKQLLRSSSSIGANYCEANNAISRQDFRNKVYICKKEAAETRYWLRLLSKTEPRAQTSRYLEEVTQLILIFQKIANSMKVTK